MNQSKRMASLRNLVSPSDQGFASLQWARAIAAMAVVIYHCGQAIEVRTGLPLTPYTNFGSAGVDIFFVISGLIMTMTTRGQVPFSAGDFLMRRVIRIVPIYWFYTLLKSAVLLTEPGASLFSEFSVSQLLASLFFIPVAEARGIYPILVVGWTLNCEILFYVLFAASKAVLPSRSMLLLSVVLTGLAGSHFMIDTGPAALTFWTDPIILEFALGIGAAELYLAGVRPSAPVTALFVLVGAGALAVLPELPMWRVLLWGVPAFLFVFVILSADRFVPFRQIRAVIAIGDSSYSLYLTHTLVIPVLAALFLRLPGLRGTAWPLLPMVGGSVIIGWLSYIFLELPMTRGMQAAWRRERSHTESGLVSVPKPAWIRIRRFWVS
jgi:exopolysaccharide production protein ExoZ